MRKHKIFFKRTCTKCGKDFRRDTRYQKICWDCRSKSYMYQKKSQTKDLNTNISYEMV